MIGRVCWRFSEVDSTQNVAFWLAGLGADHGTVVRADYQSAGRGRQGRVWESPAGSALMFSTLLHPGIPLHELGSMSILVADALADVFTELLTTPVHVKWPNDVLIDGQKTSGILLQTRSVPDPIAVLGIGINIDFPVESLPPGSTSLNLHAHKPVDINVLCADILKRLNVMWSSFQPELTAGQIEKMESRLWQLGHEVSIIDADREVRGRIMGLAKNGGLRLSVNGSERVVMAGEITRGPRPIHAPGVN